MARLPLDQIDVLVLDLIGKDISGTGMDPNVIGRAKAGSSDAGPHIGRIIVRGLTPATKGNANGIGFADVVLRRAVAAVDERTTYLNSVTAKAVESAKLPLTVDTDRDALGIALASCVRLASGRGADRACAQHEGPLYAARQRARARRRARNGPLPASLASHRRSASTSAGMFVDDDLAVG